MNANIEPPTGMTQGEWRARVELAACYRVMARYGMSDLIFNHISLRVPGTEHVLINAYGYLYTEITASNLCKIDLDGRILFEPDVGFGVNLAGYIIHSAIHQAREDVQCVIHTHTRAGMAVAAMDCGLLPLNQFSMRFYNRLGYHDYEGPASETEERERLARDIGTHNALILRNHGLLACGGSVAEAFYRMYSLENACKVQVDAMTAGAKLRQADPEVCEQSARTVEGNSPVRDPKLWAALIRQLDTESPDYRS